MKSYDVERQLSAGRRPDRQPAYRIVPDDRGSGQRGEGRRVGGDLPEGAGIFEGLCHLPLSGRGGLSGLDPLQRAKGSPKGAPAVHHDRARLRKEADRKRV